MPLGNVVRCIRCGGRTRTCVMPPYCSGCSPGARRLREEIMAGLAREMNNGKDPEGPAPVIYDELLTEDE